MDGNRGRGAPRLALSRAGLAAFSALVAAAMVAGVACLRMESLSAENDALRATVAHLQDEPTSAKVGNPEAQELQEYQKKFLAASALADMALEISDAQLRSDSMMPEFRTAQYKVPYQQLSRQIHDLNLLVAGLKKELSQ